MFISCCVSRDNFLIRRLCVCVCVSCRRNVLSLVKVNTWTKQGQMEMERFCKWLFTDDAVSVIKASLKSIFMHFFCATPSSSLFVTFQVMLPGSNLLCMCPHRSIHSSESQQEFFRMLDEKIEKVRNGGSSLEHRFVFLCFVQKAPVK